MNEAGCYARYSSENQRRESIEDQVASCRRVATEKGLRLVSRNIFTDYARSGADLERPGLKSLMAAVKEKRFEVLIVDDLSRLARDATYMLVMLADLKYHGIRIISVADCLDTIDEESTLAIQLRGIFNELLLSDLRKKTFRGQRGQKDRGFVVGERTFGYRSEPSGEVRVDKHGRERPDGYKMRVEPCEAAVVLRVFEEVAAGVPTSRLAKKLNEEGVPHAIRNSRGWAPSTLHRMLRTTKYIGEWTWNLTGTRRDPRTGRRRRFKEAQV